jgi:hypothetical protein
MQVGLRIHVPFDLFEEVLLALGDEEVLNVGLGHPVYQMLVRYAVLSKGKLRDQGVQDLIPRAVVVVVHFNQPEDLLLPLKQGGGHVRVVKPLQEKLLVELI